MDSGLDKEEVKKYYDQEAGDYKKIYREECAEYPANTIRIDFVVERLKQNKVRTILDVGCGTCTPMIRLLSEGFKVKGFDFSEEMVKAGKKELEKAGVAPNLISQGNLEDDSTLPDKKFDAILALGVFPHLSDEAKALSNMGRRLNKGGLVFIQFRNELFAAFTLNKYSLDFFLNRVIDLSSLPDDVAEEVISFHAERLKVDKPAQETRGKISFLDIQATFRNPLTIEEELFKPNGFSISKIHFYHYHALPPIFENKYPDLFRELSLKLENPSDWKGYLMASAYVVEASKND
ncbi:MAG: class I SAM-dependent methyltransferase [Dehalococcoidia bacterium]|nr:MAG: class I SAM-dependent methyltransferase [Dehalococcoidia bacterium]